MRKQMQLNKETDELLKCYKKMYYDEESYNATYGFIVNNIVEKLQPDISKIDWKLVKDTKTDKAPKVESTFITTLNLTNSAEKSINAVQKEIKEQFGVARVYMAFSVKLLIKAHYLKNIQKIKKKKK